MRYGFDWHMGLVEWLPGDGYPEPVALDVSARDRRILRDLARKVADIAAGPVMTGRREAWRRHNRLEAGRPLVLVFPEGAWRELLPRGVMLCETPETRRIEQLLRCRIFHEERIGDDLPISAEWRVSRDIRDTGWGLEAREIHGRQATGAWAFDPVMKNFSDLDRVSLPDVTFDDTASSYAYEASQDMFGDILNVTLKGITRVHFGMMCMLTLWRGLDQLLLDFCMNPRFVHDAMARISEGHARLFRQYEEMGLLDLNNDETYQASGGIGTTDELPPAPIHDGKVRLRDLWASAEAQELATVGPEMHVEFALRYEQPLLEMFGLSGYGCCEDLTDKLTDVTRIANLRRVSVCPWANVRVCAERLGNRYILSRKPNPSQMVGFDLARSAACLRDDIRAGRGCVMELIMKDTHTVENDPGRLGIWAREARRLSEEAV